MKRRLVQRVLIIAASVALAALAVRADHQLRVIRNVRLYDDHTSASRRLRTLHAGEIVTRERAGHTNNYIFVSTAQHEQGWVYRHRVAEIVHDATTDGTRAFTELAPLRDDQMRVHFIDVGQGDATLFEFPCGVALVDTGGEDSPDYNSVQPLRAYLDAFFASRPDLNETLDLLALTHPHWDHVRGVTMVSETYWLTNILDNAQENTDPAGQQQNGLRQWALDNPGLLAYRGIRERDVTTTQGLTGPIIDPITTCSGSTVDPEIRVLWGGLQPGDPGASNTNNHSLVLRIDFGASSILLTGDLQQSALNALLRKYAANPAILDVDAYQAGHHGSHNATTPALVTAMTPDIAVISMGPQDRDRGQFIAHHFAHPHHDAIEALQAGLHCGRGAVRQQIGIRGRNPTTRAPAEWEERTIAEAIFATGWDGNVVLTANSDGTFELWTERDGTNTGLHCD